jgi:hypothetical protein
MLFLSLLAACGEAPAPEASDVDGAPAAWIEDLAREPARFGTLVDPARDRWTALHRNDLIAAAALDGPAADAAPARRARAELAILHAVLADANAVAWKRLAEGLARRGTPDPAGVPAGTMAGLVGLAVRGSFVPMPDVPAAPPDASDGLHAPLPPGATLDIVRGHLAELSVRASRPVVSEGNARLWDPQVHASLSRAWSAAAGTPPTAGSAEAELFSGHLALDVAFPVGTTPAARVADAPANEVDPCEDAVRALDAAVDPWAASLAGSASDEGRALLHDLRLVEGARARRLADEGVAALRAGRHNCARAVASAAIDLADPRTVGPVNHPVLYATLAAADLRAGRTREALDALEVLRAGFPDVQGLDETVEALAVLEGMTRSGDSREN